MQSKLPADFKPYAWSQSGRPIQPYRVDPVTIAANRQDTDHQPLVDPTAQPYLVGPIHTEVLKLGPGLNAAFVAFAVKFGLHGFFEWAASAAEQEWPSPGSFSRLIDILDRYDTGFRRFTHEELAAAWDSLPEVAVRLQTRALHEGFAFVATGSDDDDRTDDDLASAARVLLERAWEADVFRIDLDLDETTDSPIIYERPRDIWSRAWFELVENARAKRMPKTCAHCRGYYIPRRRTKRFCSDECRTRAYDRKRASDPKRREAKAATYLKNKEAARTAAELARDL